MFQGTFNSCSNLQGLGQESSQSCNSFLSMVRIHYKLWKTSLFVSNGLLKPLQLCYTLRKTPARNYGETVPFYKISTTGNQVKLEYFSQLQLDVILSAVLKPQFQLLYKFYFYFDSINMRFSANYLQLKSTNGIKDTRQALREKCPYSEFVSVSVSAFSSIGTEYVPKKLRIRTPFTQ